MDFYDLSLTISLSIISGIVGGLVVVWFFQGIHFGGKGIRLNNKKFVERYVLKYSFILAILIIATFVISLAIWFFSKILENTPILLPLLIFGSLILVILIIYFKWK